MLQLERPNAGRFWIAGRVGWLLVLPIMCVAGTLHAQPRAQNDAPFHLAEATIDGIHAELRSGRLSCVQLVQSYLNRIAAYDQSGPTLNAIQNVNPAALQTAAAMDASFGAAMRSPVFRKAFGFLSLRVSFRGSAAQ